MIRPVRSESRRSAWTGCLIALLAVPQVVTQLGSGPEALRGLEGLSVLAESTSPNLWPHGITESWLEQRVTRGLQSAGIPVVAKTVVRDGRSPFIVARVQSVKVPDRQTFAWQLSLSVHRAVSVLDSAHTEVRAPVWSAEAAIGLTSGVRLANSIGQSLEEQLAELAKAWKARQGRP